MEKWEVDLPDERESEEAERFQSSLAAERVAELELQMEQDEQQTKPLPDEPPAKKKLKQELQQEALARLESSARTLPNFENIIAWWNKLDANQERRERYHEVSRSGDDIPGLWRSRGWPVLS